MGLLNNKKFSKVSGVDSTASYLEFANQIGIHAYFQFLQPLTTLFHHTHEECCNTDTGSECSKEWN